MTTDTTSEPASEPDSPGSRVDQVLLAEPRGFCAGVEMAIKALGVDGPFVPGARVLLPRDRPQPAGRAAVRAAGRGVRRRHRRRSHRACRSCCRPTVRLPRSWRPLVPAGRTWSTPCVPLVTKVHHEVKVRAGKGYRIIYVGHEGHEEAVGTMAVAPDSIDRVQSVAEVDALDEIDQPVALLGADDAVASRLGGRRRGGQASLSARVDARPQRPLLRHHQPSGGVDGTRPPVRRDRRARLGQLVQHARPRTTRPRGGLSTASTA